MMFRSDIKKFRRAMERLIVLHCQIDLYILKFHLPGHPAADLERFRSISYTEAQALERLNVLSRDLYRMPS